MTTTSLADTFLPRGSYYLVRFLEPEKESAGGIALPETALPDTQSAIVMAHGTGHLLPSGARYPMQCGVGYMVVAKANHFDRTSDTEAFVDDRDLVAWKSWHGADYAPFRAANDYVLVQPDSAKHVDAETKATVRESEGGILIACASVAGGEVRENWRGDEIVRELEALSRSRKYREQPSQYYKDRVLHDYMEALSGWELQALGAALKRKGDTNWRRHIPRRPMVRAQSGTVVSVGAGLVRGDGVRMVAPPMADEVSGVEGSWMALLAGDRVHFDKNLQAVALISDEGSLWAVRAKWIAAVETN